jgi:aminopeptidase N
MRVGERGTAQGMMFSKDGQTAAAGRCDEPLSVDADAIGFYRVMYDPATLAVNTKNFSRLPDADKIALLDDQWALVESGAAALPSYLALASSMGADLDTRAWVQIAGALEVIEYAERGAAGHNAFAGYARSILRPAFDKIGWDANGGETPDVQELRRKLIGDLGVWGDPAIIAEARKRFAAFVIDHKAIPPDNQSVILAVVARYADAATFDQLRAVVKAAADETELERYYTAMMKVGDPDLAAVAAKIALSPEIPPQAEMLRFYMVSQLAHEHQQLAWKVLTSNSEVLLKPLTTFAPLVVAQYIPPSYWSGVPLSEVEGWVRAHVPAEMSAVADRGMETARFRLAERTALVGAADNFLHK